MGASNSEEPLLPHLVCGSLPPYTKGVASPGARLSKALAELVVSNGN